MTDRGYVFGWSALILLGFGWGTAALAGELAATVAWGQRLSMGTLMAGIVQQVEVRPGQRVRSGERLLVLDQRSYRARLRAAQARLQHAELAQAEARREFERAQELYARTVLSDHELRVAEIGLREAEAMRASANADVAEAHQDIEQSQLTAPFDGVVVAVHALPGQAVNAEYQVPEMLVLADDSSLRVTGWADQDDIDDLLQSASLRVGLNGKELPATRVWPGVEGRQTPQGRLQYPVTVVVERPGDLSVWPGQAARVTW